MKHHQTIIKLLFLIGSAIMSNSPLAGLPTIPLPDTLKGDWVVLIGNCSCNITLSTAAMPEANGLKLTANETQGDCKLIKNAVAWRPYPDGISLIDKEGANIIFFSRDKEIYRSEIYGDTGFILKRK